VLCLFVHTTDAFGGGGAELGFLRDRRRLGFLLDRCRLNVAPSRARTLCVVLSAVDVLRALVRVFADERARRGYAFLRTFKQCV
jgi:hypothetical protein